MSQSPDSLKNKIQQKIIGTWRLVYSVEIDEAGNKSYPFGEDAIGYIMYDASGKMAVQICRKNRENFKSTGLKQADTNELSHLAKDYLAYFGRYEIDTEQELVHHFVEGCLYPNRVGKSLDRKYHFFEDKLSLKPWDGTNREILWQKVT